MSGSIGRRSLRSALTALVTGVLLLAGASPAAAHATLLYTTPVAGSAVPRSPESLTLTFDSPVTLPADPLRVTGPTGSPVGLGRTIVDLGSRTVKAPLVAPIDPGLYTVTWQVIADDGDAITGSYQFGVGSAAASQLSSGAPTTSTPGAATTAALRWVLFAALAWLAGRCTIRLLTRRSEPVRPLRRVDLAGCAAGAVAAAGLRAVAIGAGDIWQGITHLPSAVVTTGSGATTSVELSAFVVAGALVVGRRYGLLWLPILLVIAAEAMRSHPHEANSWLGAVVTAIHLGAIAVWMGTLVHVLLFSRTHQGQPSLPRGTWRSYARLALALVAGVLATGVLATLLLTPIVELFSTTYGLVLLVKVALVVRRAVGRRRRQGSVDLPTLAAPASRRRGRNARRDPCGFRRANSAATAPAGGRAPADRARALGPCDLRRLASRPDRAQRAGECRADRRADGRARYRQRGTPAAWAARCPSWLRRA